MRMSRRPREEHRLPSRCVCGRRERSRARRGRSTARLRSRSYNRPGNEVDLAAVHAERLADEPLMLGERRRVAVPEPLQKPRRPPQRL
jgi:hypothetical protein